MAGFTYTILTGTKATEGSIKYWANHSLVPSDQVLTEAEAYIYQYLRIREMRTTAPIAISAGQSTFTLPTAFLEPIQLLFDGWADPLEYVHESLLRRYKDSTGALYTGEPCQWAIVDETGQLDTELVDALAGDMIYYATPTALSGSNETNWLTDRYPTMLRYACMAFAYDHRKRRTDATEMRALCMGQIEAANTESDRGRRGQRLRA